jgi:hypothetical protein
MGSWLDQVLFEKASTEEFGVPVRLGTTCTDFGFGLIRRPWNAKGSKIFLRLME